MIFSKFFNFFFQPKSSFVIDEIDNSKNLVSVVDKSIGLKIDVKLEDGLKLKSAKIIEPYSMLVKYENGTSKKIRFLK